MSKVLLMVDVQNDFIDGTLGSPEAKAVVPNIKKLIENFNGEVLAITTDKHIADSHEETVERRKLPLHCMKGSNGVKIEASIYETLQSISGKLWYTIEKSTFGAVDDLIHFFDWLESCHPVDTLEICGLCTDICVLNNALIARNLLPYAEIIVYSNCCAGSTPENHEAALKILKSNLIEVKEFDPIEYNFEIGF